MLTENEKDVLLGKRKVSADNFRQIRKRARDHARNDFESLIFLAQNYPGAVNDEDLLGLLAARLRQGKILLEERKVKRLPRDVGDGRRKRGSWVQIGCVLRTSQGAPLKKPDISRKLDIAYDLLHLIHSSLSEISPWTHARQVITVTKKEAELYLGVSRFKVETRNSRILDWETRQFSEDIKVEKSLVVPVGNADPGNLAVIILEKEERGTKNDTKGGEN